MRDGAKFNGTPRCVTPYADGTERTLEDDGLCMRGILNLDPRTAAVLDLFEACSDQFMISFNGVRYALQMQSVESIARALGVTLSEWWLDKLRICANVIREQDAATVKAKENTDKR